MADHFGKNQNCQRFVCFV